MSISSKKPLYYQLKQTLLKWIEGGDYPPGSILPSEKQLQDSFGISWSRRASSSAVPARGHSSPA